MYTVGQKVRLVLEEGLDTPQEHQGHVGTVTTVYPNNYEDYRDVADYNVRMADGTVIFCAPYHVCDEFALGAKVTTTFKKGETIGGDDVPTGYFVFQETTTITGMIVCQRDDTYAIVFDEPLACGDGWLNYCYMTAAQLT